MSEMNVYVVFWGFTMEVESVWASREQAESHIWALGDVGHEVVEMPVLGILAPEITERAAA